MKKLIAQYGGMIAALALMVTAVSTTQACMFILHQPELPEGAEKLRRL